MALMNGNEHFSVNNKKINMTVLDFWSWAYSDLSEHNRRSILAEYIVASALDLAKTEMHFIESPKKQYNLLTKEGYRVNVRTAAYVESSDAEKPDFISFHISSIETFANDKQINQTSDVYVFCVYKGMKEGDSPLNLSIWDFYIIPANKRKPNQKTITLPSLMKLKPLRCDYYGIGEAIKLR